MFTVSIVLLYKGRESTHLPIPVVAAHVALFVTCTTHYAIEFNHFYTTLVGSVVLAPSYNAGNYLYTGIQWGTRIRKRDDAACGCRYPALTLRSPRRFSLNLSVMGLVGKQLLDHPSSVFLLYWRLR